jgi:hypothetical protein
VLTSQFALARLPRSKSATRTFTLLFIINMLTGQSTHHTPSLRNNVSPPGRVKCANELIIKMVTELVSN